MPFQIIRSSKELIASVTCERVTHHYETDKQNKYTGPYIQKRIITKTAQWYKSGGGGTVAGRKS